MKALRTLLALAYPLVVFGGLQVGSPRQVALGVAGLFLLRAVTRWRRPDPALLRSLLAPVLIVGGVLLATAASDDPLFLLAVPGLSNLGLLAAFARTLAGAGPPMVETFARLQGDDLSAAEVVYCRRVTLVWCVFFAANAGVSLGLAWQGDLAVWTLYNALVAYVLVALLFSVEFLVRSYRFGRYEGTLVEPLFRKIFPRRDHP